MGVIKINLKLLYIFLIIILISYDKYILEEERNVNVMIINCVYSEIISILFLVSMI